MTRTFQDISLRMSESVEMPVKTEYSLLRQFVQIIREETQQERRKNRDTESSLLVLESIFSFSF